jgi:hypothetical protein
MAVDDKAEPARNGNELVFLTRVLHWTSTRAGPRRLLATSMSSVVAAAVGRLFLGVEVHGCDRKAQVMAVCEGTGTEPGPRRRVGLGWRRRRHVGLLLVQHHHVAVDAHRRPRAHVRHHLLTCNYPHG